MEALLEIGSESTVGCQPSGLFSLLNNHSQTIKSILIRLTFVSAAIASMGASYRSPNFNVTAPTDEIAQQVARHAEHYRRELAISWVGQELPTWYSPCPVTVKVGRMGAGGYTSFSFDQGASGEMEVFGWNMVVQWSLERILDSVIPHEVSHTILACHFRRPLPRWADEGAATLAEHESEKRRQLLMVKQILHTTQRIPFKQLLSMTEYPKESQAVLSLYAQGYTLADLLVQKKGKAQYLKFLGESKKIGWETAFREYYGYQSLAALEQEWQSWVEKDCPPLNQEQEPLLATAGRRNSSARDVVIRSQTPDAPETNSELAAKPVSSSKRRLKAPRPKLVSRPSTGKQKLALNTQPDEQIQNDDSRLRNDGWIAIRTSGRAVSAMATSRSSAANAPQATARTSSSAQQRNRSRQNSLTLPGNLEMAESWPDGQPDLNVKPNRQAQIPANRRPARREEFPRRTSGARSGEGQ